MIADWFMVLCNELCAFLRQFEQAVYIDNNIGRKPMANWWYRDERDKQKLKNSIHRELKLKPRMPSTSSILTVRAP